MFFYCFNNHFWSSSTLKNKHFVRGVFQISQVVRVTSSFLFVTVFVTDFRAQLGSFLGYVSMRWQGFFLPCFLSALRPFLGLQMRPKLDSGIWSNRPLLSTAFRMAAQRVFTVLQETILVIFGVHFGAIWDDQELILLI